MRGMCPNCVSELLAKVKSKGEETEWINVEDLLPEKTGYYQVYDENSYGGNKIEVYRFDKYNQSWYFGSDAYHPSFWMPLPKPPKT